MRARFGSFEKPRGKILRNHSISLRDCSDSEMEGKPPSTYAPLSTISISSCCERTRASHTHARRTFSRCCRKRRAFPEAYRTKCVSTLEASAQAENSRAWSALMEPIPAPDVVVTDGGSGFAKAVRTAWPRTKVQRCLFGLAALSRTISRGHRERKGVHGRPRGNHGIPATTLSDK